MTNIVMDFLSSLNPSQQQAVLHKEGPLLIVAGAGSGKTRVLTHRLAYLLSQGVKPESVLAVTFTNKAANEMKNRIFHLIGNQRPATSYQQLFVGTFHSFCLKLLRQENHPWPGFTIYDDEDQRRLIKEVVEENAQNKKINPVSVKERISRAKNELIGPEEYELWADSDYERQMILPLFVRYQEKLNQARALDFDDLLLQAVKLLSQEGALLGKEGHLLGLLEKYQNQYQYLLVDEYQDVNTAQYQLLKLLTGRNKNISVVGDVDQAIYGWRGADFRNILNFEHDYPNAKVIKLEENYRSTQVILDAANNVIVKNAMRKPKNLWTQNHIGEKLTIAALQDPESEAEFVIDKILELQNTGYKLQDTVILYRTNAQSRVLEEACLKNSIPYKLIGAYRFYERKEVKDILSYLRLIENPHDLQSWKRIANVPPRSLVLPKDFWQIVEKGTFSKEGALLLGLPRHKQVAWQRLNGQFDRWRTAKKSHKTSLLVQKVMEESGYLDWLKDGTEENQDRLLNLFELLNVARSFDDSSQEGLQRFLESVALIQETDRFDPDKDQLHLMTLHLAKGLEFEIVFIAGLEEGLCPHERVRSQEETEEERRLIYVGMTRAKQKLFLTFTQRRNFWSGKSKNGPSRFLFDIPQELYEFEDYTGAGELEEQTITLE